ncbi:MAG TPA: alpha/beta hydrolase, partial [Opitutae bacterium]|nr:alpha/beta hydrolase [Opitutae bacterium]
MQTILPNVTRRRIRIDFRRERFELPDSDFIDVDWLEGYGGDDVQRCCVALHGLEGDSRAAYIKSLARSFG